MLPLEHTYLELPQPFYTLVNPQGVAELIMRNANPARVTRNKFVKELLDECEKQVGIGTAFHRFLEAIREPHQASEKYDKMLNPPGGEFDLHNKTFCGT
jgi:uncharacterized protein YdiU (UPF0061 family)